MPIVDYEHKAKIAKDFLFNREDISEKNKEYLRSFFKRYEVSPARLNLFCKHIGFLLSRVDDVKILFKNREKTNTLFEQIRKDISPAYYTTVLNVSLCFVRWLNDGEKPKGFLDVKNKGKQSQKRDLNPKDMITWEDGLKMANLTNSVQLKAIVLTQLSAGLRPSEFIDLKYGDVDKNADSKYWVARVNGKTGKRDVLLWRAIPYLQRWKEMHPTKKDKDSLWIMEDVKKSHTKTGKISSGYDYFAIQKRVRDLGNRAGINKPLDFYNLRHSCAVLMKRDGWQVELAAKNMGHSVEHFTDTYGRLSLKDKTDILDKTFGLKKNKQEEKDNPIECVTCGTINEAGRTHCEKCNSPLTLDVSLKDEQSKDARLNQLEAEMAELKALIKGGDALKAIDRLVPVDRTKPRKLVLG